MGDYGIKVSQAGKDVENAGDSELLFNSSWPVVKTLFQGRFKFSSNDNPTKLVYHNLGYVPAFLPYVHGSADDSFGIFRAIVSSDSTSIYWTPGGGATPPYDVDIGLIIFDINLEENYLAPQVDAGTSSTLGIDKDYGIKLSKSGKDVSSHDLRDFILHSGARGPTIHAIVHMSPNNGKNFIYTHDLPYDPVFFVYIKLNNKYYLLNGFAGIATIGQTIYVYNGNLAAELSLVIFKDPFYIDEYQEIKV